MGLSNESKRAAERNPEQTLRKKQVSDTDFPAQL